MNVATVSICLQCIHVSPPPYKGVAICTIDSRDILEHAATNDCPKGFFAHPPGWCAHRGEPIAEVQCETCSGKVMAKVFQCKLFNKGCTLFTKPIDGVKACGTCADRIVG